MEETSGIAALLLGGAVLFLLFLPSMLLTIGSFILGIITLPIGILWSIITLPIRPIITILTFPIVFITIATVVPIVILLVLVPNLIIGV